MNITTIVGARPQFIKSAPVSGILEKRGHREYVVHTGQHYDYNMSQIFYEELHIPKPSINLSIGSGPHGYQIAQMLIGIEEVLLKQRPEIVLVYGDTNSTLAGALAATKLRIPLAHIEAGLRSFNKYMPEEQNRVLTDHCADVLFCPTQTAVENLRLENIVDGVHQVGDTMYDAVLQFSTMAKEKATLLTKLGVLPKQYLLATVHRAENTDDPTKLKEILTAFAEICEPIIFPIHPRTYKTLTNLGLQISNNIQLIEPVGYLDMLSLESNARIILTDSGGIQKEAYFFSVPCITLRSETEWVETVNAGWNTIAGTNSELIVKAVTSFRAPNESRKFLYGSGTASESIVDILEQVFA